MSELIQTFYEPWALRALIASSTVGIMCGVLGCFIVLRNMSLIGDALSHAILPGVVFAFMLVGYSTIGFFTGAVLAGLFTAVCITWIQHNVKTKNDAAVGIVFTAMFSVGVMGISAISKDEGVHLDLKDFLFGNILGVSNEDLILTTVVAIYVLISVVVFYRYLFVTTFQPVIAETMGISVKMIHYYLMLLLSFSVVASLQTVGVILVVAMLITPASTALLLSEKLRWVLVLAGFIGLLSAVLGLVLAIQYDTTPGPAMAVTASAIYLITVFFSPKNGIISRFFRKRALRGKIMFEDTLKQSLKLQERGGFSLEALKIRMGISSENLRVQVNRLKAKGLMTSEGDDFQLTKEGMDSANQLVRAHRLWETYLVNKIGLSEEQIHEDAEKFEHLLSEELLDEVDEVLGFPEKDPHGSPIPLKRGFPDFPLFKLELEQQALIAQKQMSENITAQLWKLGLLPDNQFSIKSNKGEFIEILINDKDVRIPKELAKKINIELAK